MKEGLVMSNWEIEDVYFNVIREEKKHDRFIYAFEFNGIEGTFECEEKNNEPSFQLLWNGLHVNYSSKEKYSELSSQNLLHIKLQEEIENLTGWILPSRNDLSNDFILLKHEQLNSFYDPDRAYDGGGYDQPGYTFEFKGIIGYFEDTSCGSFGSRYTLNWNGVHADYDSVGNEIEEYSEFSNKNPDHLELLEEIHNLTGFRIKTQEEYEIMEQEQEYDDPEYDEQEYDFDE